MRVLAATFVVLLFLVFDYGVFATQTIRGSIGSTIRISCDVTIPNTSIFWRHQRSLGVRDEYVVIRNVVMPTYRERYILTEIPPSGYVLTIQNLAVNDSGSYTCIEEDGLGKRHYAKLEVHGPQTYAYILLKDGDQALLPCQGTFVRWVIQKPNSDEEQQIYGENGLADEFKLRFHVSHSDIHGDFMLSIHDAVVSDSGNYTCIDTTSDLKSRRTYNLTVKPLEGKDAGSQPQSDAASASLSVAGIIVIVTVIPTVIVILGAIIIVIFVPHCKRWYQNRKSRIIGDKKKREENLSLLAKSSVDYDMLRTKFKYLHEHGELAELDLGEVISDLQAKGVIDYTQHNRLITLRNPVERCNQLMKLFYANEEIEPFKQLRQSMTLSRNCWDFVLHMDELVFDDTRKNVVELHSKASMEKKIVLDCEEICGITVLDKKLFVLHLSARSDVEVYNAETYSLLYSIIVKNMKDPADITSCKRNNCLYISDKASSSIHKVVLNTTQHGLQTNWPVDETPRGLSVTCRFSVLVCCVSANMIKEFTTDGQFIRKVKLPSDSIVQPSNQAEEHQVGGASLVSKTQATGFQPQDSDEMEDKLPLLSGPAVVERSNQGEKSSAGVQSSDGALLVSKTQATGFQPQDSDEMEDKLPLLSGPAVVERSNQGEKSSAGVQSSEGASAAGSSAQDPHKAFEAGSSALAAEMFSNKVDSPWHAIELPLDRFVVCHGKQESVSGPSMCIHRVCIVNANGEVLNMYGGKKGSELIGQLDGPGHLAVDKDDFIFVADSYNSRVLLLSPTLKFAREIMSPTQVRYPIRTDFAPNRLCLDKDKRRLFVADRNEVIVTRV